MSTITEPRTLVAENIGPISNVVIPCPEEGGLVVMRGRNGSGKTTLLNATESLVTGHGKLSVRDGQLHGKLAGLGAQMTVSRSTRRSGELEVHSLDGRLSPAELVDPGMKDPDAADSKRIKALIALAGAKPDASLFYPLLGSQGEFEARVSPKAIESDDLITMAARVKRDLESKAREEEDRAEHADGHAKASKEAAEGVDVTAECDSAKLQAALEEAVRRESELRAADRHAGDLISKAAVASDALEDAAAEYDGPTPDQAAAARNAAMVDRDIAVKAVRDAEEALRRAKSELLEAERKLESADAAKRTADAHEKVVAQFRDQIAAAKNVDRVDPADLAKATEAVTAARQAIERGALVRKAKEHLELADRSAKVAAAHRLTAFKLREAAKGTDEVLSAVVAKTGSPLRVEAGRLVLDTHRGVTYFADLSHGERWKIALDIAIEAVGSDGLLTCPQEAFESLDPDNRRLIHDHLVGSGVVMLTAEAADGDLRAEVFTPA